MNQTLNEEKEKKHLPSTKRLLLGYLLCVGISLLMAVGIMFYEDVWHAANLLDILHFLSDAFAVPGIIFLGLGALVWASEHDAFVGLSYLGHFVLTAFVPVIGMKKRETYREYRERVTSAPKNKNYKMFLFVGAAFTAIAIIILLFYLAND